MKKNYFLAMAASMLVVSMAAVSCNPKDGGPEDPPVGGEDKTLIVSPGTVNVGWFNPGEATLTVTTDADSWTIGATAGWYTAVKSGTDKIVITAQSNDGAARNHTFKVSAPGAEDFNVTVNQAAAVVLHPSLKGEKYIVLQLDETSYSYIADKVVASYMPDDVEGGNNLWLWAGLGAGTASGLNFYGLDYGWVALVTAGATGAGWSGGGYNSGGAIAKPDFSMIDDDWYFHVVLKGTATAKYEIVLDCGNGWNGNAGKEYKFNVGAGTEYPLSMTEWTEVEIPMTTILDAGWLALANSQMENGGCNSFNFFMGAVDGMELQWDALFFYKK